MYNLYLKDLENIAKKRSSIDVGTNEKDLLMSQLITQIKEQITLLRENASQEILWLIEENFEIINSNLKNIIYVEHIENWYEKEIEWNDFE